SNLEAELVNYDSVAHDFGARVSSANEASDLIKHRRTHYLGDACERTPLVRAALVAEAVPCPSPLGCSKSSATSRLEGDLFAFAKLPALSGSDQPYGFRFWECDASDSSSVEGRVECATTGPSRCTTHVASLQGDLFVSSNPQTPWRLMTIDGTKQEQFGGVFAQTSGGGIGDVFQHRWNFELDGAFLTTPVPPATLQTRPGVILAHARRPPSNQFSVFGGDQGPATDIAVTVVDRSNVLLDGVAKRITQGAAGSPPLPPPGSKFSFPVPPSLAAKLPFNWCLAGCDFGNHIPFLVNPYPDQIWGESASSRQNLTDRISATVRPLFTSGRLVGADEPSGSLGARGARWSAVHLDASGALSQILVSNAEGIAPLYRDTAGDRISVRTPSDPALVYAASATRDSVFRLGGKTPAGTPSGELWVLDVSTSGEWRKADLYGDVRPANVLAAAYHHQTDALYIVDEVKKGRWNFGRILRIRRDSIVDVLGEWPRVVRASVTMGTAETGELVIGFSKGRAHAIAVVGVDLAGKLDFLGWRLGGGALVATPRVSADWISLAVAKGRTWEIDEVQRSGLKRCNDPLGFGWW
ncbi:MAG: hypothetical protein IT377_03015, partial [Polyangiaceae bacterium]|nr:hypothetical protein [Polyangiaceae bacterium]